MRSYSRGSPYGKMIDNPQITASHVAKLQNLLEQYDRQNVYLNKQVNQLLKINRNLTHKHHFNYDHLLAKRIVSDGRSRYQRDNKNNKYDCYKKKYNYTGLIQQEEKQKKRQTIDLNKDKRKALQKNFILQNTSVKYTRDPYIQQQSIVKDASIVKQIKQKQIESVIRPEQKIQSRILRNDDKIITTKSRQSSPIKKGIQLLSKSTSKEKTPKTQKSPQKLQNSKLQNDYQHQKQKQIVEEEKELIKKEEIKMSVIKEQQIENVNMKIPKNNYVMPNVVFTPVNKLIPQKKIFHIPAQQKINYQTNSQKKIINVPYVSNQSYIRPKNFNQTQVLNRISSLNNFERKQSQHKILPTNLNISNSHKSVQNKNLIERSKSARGKKKFITILSSALVQIKKKEQQEKKNIQENKNVEGEKKIIQVKKKIQIVNKNK